MRVGTYDHLSQSDPLIVPVTFDDLTNRIVKMNYGTHRLLSALVRSLEKEAARSGYPSDFAPLLTEMLKDIWT